MLSGGPVWSAGRYGGALSFDGTNDLVTVADSASLDLRGPLTMSAWLKPRTLGGGYRTVVLKEAPGAMAYGMYAAGDGTKPSGYVDNGAEQSVISSVTLSTKAWKHLAVTYDGTALRIYVDGVLRHTAGTVVSASLRPVVSDYQQGGTSLVVDRLLQRASDHNRAPGVFAGLFSGGCPLTSIVAWSQRFLRVYGNW